MVYSHARRLGFVYYELDRTVLVSSLGGSAVYREKYASAMCVACGRVSKPTNQITLHIIVQGIQN